MNQLHHIAIIGSSSATIDFYKSLGFTIVDIINRGKDSVVFLSGFGITLEIFIDCNHPKRLSNPEALGLRHLALEVDNFNEWVKNYSVEQVKKDWDGECYFLISDPDGLPIEIHE